MKLTYPIPNKYMAYGKICYINQLFGDQKNRSYYDERGHKGIDFKTTGHQKYRRNNRTKSGWSKDEHGRDKYESDGRIPILACHDGIMRTVLYTNKEGMGWGVFVTAKPEIEDGEEVQYRTLYWHIETPWGSLKMFSGDIKSIEELHTIYNEKEVKGGSPISIAGNNGMSTGPHVHLELHRRKKVNGVWWEWQYLNPMEYFKEKDVVAVATYANDSDVLDWSKVKLSGGLVLSYWYLGEQITEEEHDIILNF